MYFFKVKGKQVLDLRGDFILSHNDNLVKGRIKSAAPANVHNAEYIPDIMNMGVIKKFQATILAIGFIWSKKSKALTKETIESECISTVSINKSKAVGVSENFHSDY